MEDVYSLPMSQQKDADVSVERCRCFGWKTPMFWLEDADVSRLGCRCFGRETPTFFCLLYKYLILILLTL